MPIIVQEKGVSFFEHNLSTKTIQFIQSRLYSKSKLGFYIFFNAIVGKDSEKKTFLENHYF